jgi:hypothetical protein
MRGELDSTPAADLGSLLVEYRVSDHYDLVFEGALHVAVGIGLAGGLVVDGSVPVALKVLFVLVGGGYAYLHLGVLRAGWAARRATVAVSPPAEMTDTAIVAAAPFVPGLPGPWAVRNRGAWAASAPAGGPHRTPVFGRFRRPRNRSRRRRRRTSRAESRHGTTSPGAVHGYQSRPEELHRGAAVSARSWCWTG